MSEPRRDRVRRRDRWLSEVKPDEVFFRADAHSRHPPPRGRETPAAIRFLCTSHLLQICGFAGFYIVLSIISETSLSSLVGRKLQRSTRRRGEKTPRLAIHPSARRKLSLSMIPRRAGRRSALAPNEMFHAGNTGSVSDEGQIFHCIRQGESNPCRFLTADFRRYIFKSLDNTHKYFLRLFHRLAANLLVKNCCAPMRWQFSRDFCPAKRRRAVARQVTKGKKHRKGPRRGGRCSAPLVLKVGFSAIYAS